MRRPAPEGWRQEKQPVLSYTASAKRKSERRTRQKISLVEMFSHPPWMEEELPISACGHPGCWCLASHAVPVLVTRGRCAHSAPDWQGGVGWDGRNFSCERLSSRQYAFVLPPHTPPLAKLRGKRGGLLNLCGIEGVEVGISEFTGNCYRAILTGMSAGGRPPPAPTSRTWKAFAQQGWGLPYSRTHSL